MTSDLYQSLIRPVLFSGVKADPEWLHSRLMQVLQSLEQPLETSPWLDAQFQRSLGWVDARLEQTLWQNSPPLTVTFPNPVGVAAGFDKDGTAAGVWSRLGFGFAELGTVTKHPQPGNDRPRLFRLLEDQAVLNRMGFNNQGAEALAQTLTAQPPCGQRRIPLGVNLGKSKITPLEEAAADYLASFQWLKTLGDYFVVNVSSPNTPGLRSLQAKEQLAEILEALQQENQGQKPLLIKIAPDLAWDAIVDVLQLIETYQLAGIIATNTTIRRDHLQTQMLETTGKSIQEEAGGISGKPLRDRSTEVIRFIWQQTQGKVPIIGVGGIFTAEDAWEKITAGATLIQVYTGWVYEGPWMIRRILQGLSQKLQQQGLSSISQAIGIGAD